MCRPCWRKAYKNRRPKKQVRKWFFCCRNVDKLRAKDRKILFLFKSQINVNIASKIAFIYIKMKQSDVFMIVACIFCFGFSTFFRKLALDRLHPFQFQIIAGIIYLSLIPFYQSGMKLAASHQEQYSFLAIVLVTATILFHVVGINCFGFVLKNSNSVGMTTVLVSTSPILTLALCWLFLGEQLTVMKICGGGLTLLGIMLLLR